MVHWILNHICGEDRSYVQHFREQGILVDSHHLHGSDGPTVKESALAHWEKHNLTLHIADIDRQHKELVHILQQLNDLQKSGDDRRQTLLPSIIKKLYYYSQYHFVYEEELMSAHGFDHIKEHRDQHQDFILKVSDFAREYSLKKETLSDETVVFLREWVVHHILEEDKKYTSSLLKGD